MRNALRPQSPWLLVALAAVVGSAVGQSAPPAASAPQIATIPFVDKSFGYRMQVPAGWVYDRVGFFGPAGSQGLLRGASGNGQNLLQVLLFQRAKITTLRDWLELFATQLGSISGVISVKVKFQETFLDNSQRPYGWVHVSARDGADLIETYYYVLRFDETTVWMFGYNNKLGRSLEPSKPVEPTRPEETTFEIPPVVQQMASSVDVFFDPRRVESLRESLERGKDFITGFKLQEAIREMRAEDRPRYFEIVLGKEPIGYLAQTLKRESRALDDNAAGGKKSAGKDGLRVSEESWRFGSDGTTFRTVIDLFSSVDGDSDLFEITEIRLPSQKVRDARRYGTRDQVIREGDVLFSSYRTSLDVGNPEQREPIRIEANYLGLAWARCLPSLLGAEERPPIAFTVYDPETRALVAQEIHARGPAEVPGEKEKGLLFELREGLLETPTRVYTDVRGNLLRMESGDMTMRAVDQKSVDKRFGARRDAAKARM